MVLSSSSVEFKQSSAFQEGQGLLLELSGSSSIWAESSSFSGSIGRKENDGIKSYVLYKDCEFAPTLNARWARSMDEVYVCTFGVLF